ncbi:unnamed protein product, partial [Oppiella nova]
MDLCDEMSWAMEVSVGLGGPVVFTHNDLMRRNILVRNTCHTNADDLDVFIVDYDWSCYMFRGADFADYFIDWCQPELDFGGNDFPTDQQMYAFIDAYISEMSALSGDSYTKRVVNSRETLVKEAKESMKTRTKIGGKIKSNVSVEDRLKVYELCKTHLGGHWSDVSADQLVIKPTIYMSDDIIEIWGITQQTAISILMSEINISPKIYGMFENGFISEFIDCRYFNADDDLNPIAVKLLAQKVAKMHSKYIPIARNGTQKTLKIVFEDWFDSQRIESYRQGVIRKEIEKQKCETLMEMDFVAELAWVRKAVVHLNSPEVFCHNDLNRRNILVRNGDNDHNLD